MDNLIDWKLELTLQERLTRREAVASFVDDAGLTLALAMVPCRATEAFAAWWGFRGDDRDAGIAEEAWRATVEYVTGGHFSTAVSAEK